VTLLAQSTKTLLGEDGWCSLIRQVYKKIMVRISEITLVNPWWQRRAVETFVSGTGTVLRCYHLGFRTIVDPVVSDGLFGDVQSIINKYELYI
jgi:hypothetical protein